MVQCLRALYAVRGNQVWPHLQYIQYAQKCQTATAAEGSYGKRKTTGTSHVSRCMYRTHSVFLQVVPG